MPGTEAVESRGLIVLARFDARTVLRETSGDTQGIWRDGEAGAESVGRLAQLADAEGAEPTVGHEPNARAEGSHSPEPCA
ncbi:hypothetical protein AVDCRST_MAG82-2475 [uncultured Rubrobacteraceae bacterium]|uniref:Uncharacterized protein n=1 Tax=uncultured Rubrobacteraceae bacterium TaxID=349277 RepID=A0A6J4QC45_9ACTN|nr:hypothetical protein AVDCRST_MAG82-2475 [uncultured Rubrobacteraceae bacterium]